MEMTFSTSKYVVTKEEYGRTVRVIDMQAFARDLAEAMGGTYKAPGADDMSGSERYATFDLDGYEIGLTRSWEDRKFDKVTVNITPRDVKFSYNEAPRSDDYKLPRATLSVSKPMDRIVADINRRVIKPAEAPSAKRREYAAEQVRKANSLADTAERLRKLDPLLSVRLDNGATYSGSLYRNADDGPYLSGRVYADGKVSIDSLGQLTEAQFKRVLAVLYPRERKETK